MAKSLSSKIPDFTRLGILSLTWTSEHYDLEYVKSLVTRSSFEIINIQPCVKKDRLFRHYDTVLKGAVLTTFGGVLFGFLLNISIRSANQLLYLKRMILVLALFSTTITVSLFVMPVIYHHVQFPYTDIDKFID